MLFFSACIVKRCPPNSFWPLISGHNFPLFISQKGSQGEITFHGINKYCKKVTFPSVICATSKSNYILNDVGKAVFVFSHRSFNKMFPERKESVFQIHQLSAELSKHVR